MIENSADLQQQKVVEPDYRTGWRIDGIFFGSRDA